MKIYSRCKARLNIILARTGEGAEVGPRLEAPRFQSQIQPVVVAEGAPAEFKAIYTGSPGIISVTFICFQFFIEAISFQSDTSKYE